MFSIGQKIVECICGSEIKKVFHLSQYPNKIAVNLDLDKVSQRFN